MAEPVHIPVRDASVHGGDSPTQTVATLTRGDGSGAQAPKDDVPLENAPDPSGHDATSADAATRRLARGPQNQPGDRSNGNNNPGHQQNHRTYTGHGKKAPGVRVLLLTFEFSDLELESETKMLKYTFESLGFEVEDYRIEMKEPLRPLKKTISNFIKDRKFKDLLHVVYYHGHGGVDPDKKSFLLSSHNQGTKVYELWKSIRAVWGRQDLNALDAGLRENTDLDIQSFQPISTVEWEEIKEDIMESNRNTLIILDCCHAGLAAVHAQENDGFNFNDRAKLENRKEMIGACGWGEGTSDHMSPALCDVLNHGLSLEDATMSTTTLVRRMNDSILKHWRANRRDEAPQAVHYVLRSSRQSALVFGRYETKPTKLPPLSLVTYYLAEGVYGLQPPEQFLQLFETYRLNLGPGGESPSRLGDENIVRILSCNPRYRRGREPKISARNDALQGYIKGQKGRIRGFAILPMEKPGEAKRELRRCVTKLTFCGAFIEIDNANPIYHEKEYRNFWKEADKLGKPIYLHPVRRKADQQHAALTQSGFQWPADVSLFVLRLFHAGLFKECPNLKLVVAHSPSLSFLLPGANFGGLEGFQSSWDKSVWVTTSGYRTEPQVSALVRMIDYQRILFSEPDPIYTFRAGRDLLQELRGSIPDNKLRALAYENATNLLDGRL